MGQPGFRAARFFPMAAPRKKRSVSAPVPQQPVARPRKRFYMQKMPDGVGERAVRVRSTTKEVRDQVLADYLCCTTSESLSSNQRSMESLLGELLSEWNLQEDTLAPELLAQAWTDAVGDALGSVSALVSVGKGRARIRVNHPTVRYEITRMKPQIIRALNQTLGSGSVRALQIVSD